MNQKPMVKCVPPEYQDDENRRAELKGRYHYVSKHTDKSIYYLWPDGEWKTTCWSNPLELFGEPASGGWYLNEEEAQKVLDACLEKEKCQSQPSAE